MSSLSGERKSEEVFVDSEGHVWVRLARTWKPGPIPKNLVAQVKRRFLISMAATNHIAKSASFAGVSTVTIHTWVRRGIIAREEVAEASKRYQEHGNSRY